MKSDTVKRIVFYLLLLLVAVSIFMFNGTKERMFSVTYMSYLNTVCEITIASKTDAPFNECKDYLAFAEKEFSAEDENAVLFKLNKKENISPSNDLSEAIAKGKEFSSKYPEYFSVYLDKLIKTWNINGQPTSIPTQNEIENALNFEDINLGAIAKGYITDKLVEKLHKNEVSSALINLGGNTYAMGKKHTGENWKIGIQDPKDENGIIGSITAENVAVVTSGDYQRYAEIDGKRYHHILDPKTGFPADCGVHSVTVISKDATTADALSTAAFVAGVTDGNKLLEENDAMGIFITDDTIYLSKGLEDIFKQEDSSYKYEFLY